MQCVHILHTLIHFARDLIREKNALIELIGRTATHRFRVITVNFTVIIKTQPANSAQTNFVTFVMET